MWYHGVHRQHAVWPRSWGRYRQTCQPFAGISRSLHQEVLWQLAMSIKTMFWVVASSTVTLHQPIPKSKPIYNVLYFFSLGLSRLFLPRVWAAYTGRTHLARTEACVCVCVCVYDSGGPCIFYLGLQCHLTTAEQPNVRLVHQCPVRGFYCEGADGKR